MKLLYKDFEIKKGDIISVVGAGGKSTLIYTIAQELADSNLKVVITTTTHILADYKPHNFDIVAGPVKEGRLTAVSSETLSNLISNYDIVLIEADGSRQLPLKAPANHEPVIYNCSNKLIIVGSKNAINGNIYEVCHRPEIVKSIINKDTIDSIEDIFYVLTKGYKNHYLNPTYIAIRTGEISYEITKIH